MGTKNNKRITKKTNKTKYNWGTINTPYNVKCNCIEVWCGLKKGKRGYIFYISNKGRIFNVKLNKFVGYKSVYGYMLITGFNETRINRLVYGLFKDNNLKGFDIDHKNTDKEHNCTECNLIKTTHKQNCNNPLTLKHYSKAKTGVNNPNYTGGCIFKTKWNTYKYCYYVNTKNKSKTFKTYKECLTYKTKINNITKNNMLL